ncbi:MAG: glycosyltransferase family 4 protein [Ktedonobacteraceae bacterium]
MVKDRLRICCISFKFSPIIGGAEARTEKQARQLQALGHDVTIVTLRHNKQWQHTEQLDGLPVIRVGGIHKRGGKLRIGKFGHLLIMLALFLTLWRLRHRYDVIHVFQLTPIAVVATLIGKITRKPVVISISSAGPSQEQQKRLRQGTMLMTDTLTNTDFLKVYDATSWEVEEGNVTYLPKVTFGGQSILNYLRKSNAFYHILSTRSYSYLISHGFRAKQIVHIPGGVDTEKFRPAQEQRLNLAKPERTIICVARLDFPKGIDVLLHAWGRMMHDIYRAEWLADLKPRLHLVGDGIFRPQMERIAAELGIQDTVVFLGQRTDTIELLQQSWGFVLPSRWEGMPNALLEAMACGLPCIATRVSGSEDIISEGCNGLLVEPEQPAEMALALRRIIEDSELAQRLGKEGRRRVVSDYQLTKLAEQSLELYRRLLKGWVSLQKYSTHPLLPSAPGYTPPVAANRRNDD